MAKKEQTIEVGVANQDGFILVTLSEAREWEPKKKTIIGGYVHFSNGEKFLSMHQTDFKEVYGE